MLSDAKIAMLIVASGVLLATPPRADAQSATRITQTDPRWYCVARLLGSGCVGERRAEHVVERDVYRADISGSSAVEALTIARHKVVARDRLDSSRPHSLDGQGCRGWKRSTGRRRAAACSCAPTTFARRV